MRTWRIILAAAVSLLLVTKLADSQAEEQKSSASYKLVLPSTLHLEVGSAGELEIALVPVDGFRVDLHGPLKITFGLAGPSHVAIKKRSLSRSDALDSQSEAPRFRVAVRPKSAGQEKVSIRYRFWLCRSKICRPLRGEAILSVDVKEAPAPDAGPAEVPPAAP